MSFLEVIGGPQKILHLATKLSCNKDTSFSFWRSYNQQSLILLKKDDAQGDVQNHQFISLHRAEWCQVHAVGSLRNRTAVGHKTKSLHVYQKYQMKKAHWFDTVKLDQI